MIELISEPDEGTQDVYTMCHIKRILILFLLLKRNDDFLLSFFPFSFYNAIIFIACTFLLKLRTV